MDLFEPYSLVFGIIVGITACYALSDLVFPKESENESDDIWGDCTILYIYSGVCNGLDC